MLRRQASEDTHESILKGRIGRYFADEDGLNMIDRKKGKKVGNTGSN